METQTWPVDLVAEDRDGRPVLIVEVKSAPIRDESEGWFLSTFEGAPPTVRFGMLVDFAFIRIYRRGESAPTARFDTGEVLRHYSPTYSEREYPHGHVRILELHIRTLLDAWLQDLIYHWKSAQPPKIDDIATMGLLGMIEGGTTSEEVMLDGGPLR